MGLRLICHYVLQHPSLLLHLFHVYVLFFAPFSQLCYRIDKLYHLMCRLPFQSEVIILYFLKHHFPRFRVKTDITCRMFPCSIHKAILNSQLHSLFFCKISQFPEYLAKLFICGFYRLSFPRSCKVLTCVAPNFPAVQITFSSVFLCSAYWIGLQ